MSSIKKCIPELLHQIKKYLVAFLKVFLKLKAQDKYEKKLQQCKKIPENYKKAGSEVHM